MSNHHAQAPAIPLIATFALAAMLLCVAAITGAVGSIPVDETTFEALAAAQQS